MDVMRPRRCTSRSQEIVLSNDDLLTLILVHVPWKKLKVFKCVSRQWHSLITAPHFRNLLLLPLRASSLIFIQPLPINLDYDLTRPNKVYLVPLDDPDTPSPFRTLTSAHGPFDPQRIHVLRSCNGLLLCSAYLFAPPYEQCDYCVYNPSTNQLAILPQHPPAHGDAKYVGLAFDPSKSLHYKVIVFVHTSRPASLGDFHVYSSETGTWRVSLRSFFRAQGMRFKGGVYWHGSIHWLAVSHCLYFNVDEGRVKTFPGPPIGEDLNLERTLYFGESEDHLHLINEVCSHSIFLSVYEMKSDYSEWFIKYRIDLSPVRTQYKAYAVSVLSLIRRENFQEDSFLVLGIPGKAIRYNLVDRSFKELWDSAVDFGLEKVDRRAFRRLKVWQYIETLPCV